MTGYRTMVADPAETRPNASPVASGSRRGREPMVLFGAEVSHALHDAGRFCPRCDPVWYAAGGGAKHRRPGPARAS